MALSDGADWGGEGGSKEEEEGSATPTKTDPAISSSSCPLVNTSSFVSDFFESFPSSPLSAPEVKVSSGMEGSFPRKVSGVLARMGVTDEALSEVLFRRLPLVSPSSLISEEKPRGRKSWGSPLRGSRGVGVAMSFAIPS